MPRTLCWFSCGAASAVATKLTLKDTPDALVVYCETGAEHPDNDRFLRDCEKWFGVEIQQIKSTQHKDTWDVWEKRRYLSGIKGAPCTSELKFIPRLNFQLPSDIHVFGYTYDKADQNRAKRMLETYPDMAQRHPLIEYKLNKAACLAMVMNAGIEAPIMYGLGFHNNNCIPCVKATSPAYWALVRQHFPAEFSRMADLSHKLGARLARINNERVFIDQIPADQPTKDPIAPACDFLCQYAEETYDDTDV